MSEIEATVFRHFYDAIEAKLRSLVSTGISIERIKLEHHPNLTKITVDGVPVADFKITYQIGSEPVEIGGHFAVYGPYTPINDPG